jgi:MFS family permease
MSSHLRRLFWVRGLRAFGDGFVSLLLPLYLIELGLDPFQIGAITAGTLLGSGVLTLAIGLCAHRFQLRSLLLAASLLMAATGMGFVMMTTFWPLLLIAVVGTLNPSSGDVSVFMPLEQTALAHLATERNRTAVFARYSLVGSLVAALGALCAGAPGLLVDALGISLRTALQLMFGLYGLIGLIGATLYRKLPADFAGGAQMSTSPLKESRRTVYTLAALFSLDAFGGGFVVQSMLALWLFERFQLSIELAATIFFWSGVLTAFSYLVAVRIAGRFGLINTMVFTHLPASVLLVIIPLMPSLPWVICLLLVRSALSQMDVPTRSSYVMAVVTPSERAAAASITSVPRSLASSISPLIAGSLLQASVFGWPLVCAGVLKMIYDLLLLSRFRALRPPEESAPKR